MESKNKEYLSEKNQHFLCFLSFNINVHADIDPQAYTIQQPVYNLNGFSQGIDMVAKIAKAKRDQAQKIRYQEREDTYRAELKNLDDDPSTLSRANLLKLMLIYPEYTDNTSKIIESMDKSGLLKD